MKTFLNRVFLLNIIVLQIIIAGGKAFSQPSNDYDQSLDKLVRRLKEFPRQSKNIAPMSDLFAKANKQDQDNIIALKLTGQPDIWYNIFRLYSRLDNRQKQVMTLSDGVLAEMGFHMEDYDKDIMEARKYAIAYFYAYAQKLLGYDKPDSARKAYDQLFILAGMKADISNLDKMIRQSILVGARNIQFELYNNTGKVLNEKITEELSRLVWDYKMKRYGQARPVKHSDSYDFTFRVMLNDLSVSTDQIKKLNYGEARDVYKNGVVVDTIGCNINETRQRKTANISGSIIFIDDQNGQKVNIIPISVESIFLNKFATLQGDPEAAGDETLKLLKNKEVPYPSNEQIIMDAVRKFTIAASQEIFGSQEENGQDK